MCIEESRLKKREAEGTNRGRGAFDTRRPSHRGLGEVGLGSAGSVLKVKGGVGWGGGGVCSALRSKNWKKEGCFLLSLKSRRETGESEALQRLWHYNQRLEAALTEWRRWLRTQSGRISQRT